MQFKEMQKKAADVLHNFYFEFADIWYRLFYAEFYFGVENGRYV
jgi:hypothetical protein